MPSEDCNTDPWALWWCRTPENIDSGSLDRACPAFCLIVHFISYSEKLLMVKGFLLWSRADRCAMPRTGLQLRLHEFHVFDQQKMLLHALTDPFLLSQHT